MVWDFLTDFRPAVTEMARWIREGKLKFTEHVIDGFDQAPAAFCDLFSGSAAFTNAGLGRSLVRL